MTTLVEQLRDAGIKMGSKTQNQWVGWTTNQQKMEAAQQLGAHIQQVNNGWDISCPAETNVIPIKP